MPDPDPRQRGDLRGLHGRGLADEGKAHRGVVDQAVAADGGQHADGDGEEDGEPERREAELRSALAQAGVDALELSTDSDLVDAILRFADLRKRRSQLAAGGSLPDHLRGRHEVSMA